MNSTQLILLALVAASNAYILLPYSLSNDLIQHTAQLEKPSNNNTCPSISLNYCQYQFNTAFGLNDSITWRNGTVIFNTVQQNLSSTVAQLINVCSANNNFHQCLGNSYYNCMNLDNLLQNPKTDATNAFDYVRTFRGLEWICGGGFREVIHQWNCFESFPTTNAYKHCISNFNETVSTSNFCPAIQQTGNCLNTAYNALCGAGAGYFGCESFELTFANACTGLKCEVDH